MRLRIEMAFVAAALLLAVGYGSARAGSRSKPPPGYPTRTVPDTCAVEPFATDFAARRRALLKSHARNPGSGPYSELARLAGGGAGRWNGRTILSVVDWDRDGDWDLVAGMRAKGERLRYYQNVGTRARPRLKYIGGFPTRRSGGHYQMAEFHDFDGDGQLDVVAGSDHGLIYYFRKLPVAHK